jgi:hypothetical protein
MQVFAEGKGRSRIVWIADLLPHEFAGYVAANMERGVGIMKKTLEQG